MPKTNLCRPREDPRKAEVRAAIAAGMARQGMSRQKLAAKINMPISTFNYRYQNPETIRLDEFWAMMDALKVSEDDRAKTI